jgi:hypothetical protein
MEHRLSRFEDHLNVVTGETEKNAGRQDPSLLDKLANELGFYKEEAEKTAQDGVTAPGAPAAEGEVSPAASSVAGAAAPVVAATEAVATPQTTIAGGNPAEAAAGEVPAQTKPNEGVAISAGDGKITDANQLHKTPEAVAAAAEGGGGDEASAATPTPENAGAVPDQSLGAEKTAEAVKIGQLIANSFQDTLEKQAQDAQYSEALGILEGAGLLDGYRIKDRGIQKTASEIEVEGCLEKISANQSLSREEIIGAAIEFVEFEKTAADVEAQAREDAREFAKQAEAESKVKATDNEKIAALMEDQNVVNAVQILKNKGLL